MSERLTKGEVEQYRKICEDYIQGAEVNVDTFHDAVSRICDAISVLESEDTEMKEKIAELEKEQIGDGEVLYMQLCSRLIQRIMQVNVDVGPHDVEMRLAYIIADRIALRSEVETLREKMADLEFRARNAEHLHDLVQWALMPQMRPDTSEWGQDVYYLHGILSTLLATKKEDQP